MNQVRQEGVLPFKILLLTCLFAKMRTTAPFNSSSYKTSFKKVRCWQLKSKLWCSMIQLSITIPKMIHLQNSMEFLFSHPDSICIAGVNNVDHCLCIRKIASPVWPVTFNKIRSTTQTKQLQSILMLILPDARLSTCHKKQIDLII